MKKIIYKSILSLLLVAGALNAQSQKVEVTFEDLSLSKSDTFYKGDDKTKKYMSNNIIFKNYYSDDFGYVSWGGFAYSNKKDTTTSGYTNDISAVTGIGYNSSNQYATAYSSTYSGGNATLILPTKDSVMGFYITNNTYTALSMKNGDQFSKKFGGEMGLDPDYLKVIAYGWENGEIKSDSSIFYLADFRRLVNSNSYIVKDWRWFDLTNLGVVDSISFGFESTDNGMYGINTPTYFCMDNFTYKNSTLSLSDNISLSESNIYPNPFDNQINIQLSEKSNLSLFDINGKLINEYSYDNGLQQIELSFLLPGVYILKINSSNKVKSMRLIKK